MPKAPRLLRARRFAALVSFVALASCGSCNCGVPPYTTTTTTNLGPSAVATAIPTTVATTVPVAMPTSVATTIATTMPGGVATTVPTTLPTTIATTVPTTAPTTASTTVPVTASCNQGAGAVALGAALTPFALLAGSAITNTGLTVVTYAAGAVTGSLNDDLIGVSPGTSVSGFYPPGTDSDGPSAIYAVGAGYSNNMAVPLAAQSALTTAYNTLAGMASTTTFPGGQDLSQASVPGYPTGTLPPGVYKSASTMMISAGNLTLNGGGNPQSVFVFQMGSALNTSFNGAAAGNVVLTNGASACNIYWQVGSSAVLGGQTFYGDILALASITLTSATQFTGRALARTAAVTISIASQITNPGGR